MRVTKDAIRSALADVLGDVPRDDFEKAVSAAYAVVDPRPKPPEGWRYLSDFEAESLGGATDTALIREAGEWAAVVDGEPESYRAELHDPGADTIPPAFFVGTSSLRAALKLAELALAHAASVGISESAIRARFYGLGFEPL